MQLISPLLPDFLARYPQLRLELDINNHPVSLIGERIDVAIRITDNPEPGAIARRLGVCRSVLCASPRWLQLHGQPQTPAELSEHNCLHYSHFVAPSWQLTDSQGEEVSVAVSGNLSAGISSLLLEAAVAGCGIAMLPELEAQRALNSGALKPVLPGWTPKALSVYGIYLSRDYQPSALPLFLDEINSSWRSLASALSYRRSCVAPCGRACSCHHSPRYLLPGGVRTSVSCSRRQRPLS
jgi:DNA-binding transcriptional LysR family regulator